jgi:hypothetical protein
MCAPFCLYPAGYDTTSSAITYMLNQLALNPHVLEQVGCCASTFEYLSISSRQCCTIALMQSRGSDDADS